MIVALVFILAFTGAASAAERVPVGAATRVQGEVRAAHAGAGRTVRTGSDLYLGDTLLTGTDARVQVRLTDGTDLTLGADGALTLDDLLVAPQGESGGLSVLAGAFRLIAPSTPGATVRTPYATIGIRGTEFWGGPLDGVIDVVALEGTVDVTTAGGMVVLTAGQGTVVPVPGAPPTVPASWSPEKVARAIGTVAFQ
jgi:hypothetical protein